MRLFNTRLSPALLHFWPCKLPVETSITSIASISACVLVRRTVHFEQEVAKVVKNVARILQVADRLDVPFYLGADEPLLGDVIDAAYVSKSCS